MCTCSGKPYGHFLAAEAQQPYALWGVPQGGRAIIALAFNALSQFLKLSWAHVGLTTWGCASLLLHRWSGTGFSFVVDIIARGQSDL